VKVLQDENLDHALRKLLGPHEVVTAAYMGSSGLKNGELLRAAEDRGLDVLLTGDQTLSFEQNLRKRRLAIVALSAIQLPIIKSNLPAIVEAIDKAEPDPFRSSNAIPSAARIKWTYSDRYRPQATWSQSECLDRHEFPLSAT
jgi:hypothetical protein